MRNKLIFYTAVLLTIILQFLLIYFLYLSWWNNTGSSIFGFLFISGAVAVPSFLSTVSMISNIVEVIKRDNLSTNKGEYTDRAQVLIPIRARDERDVTLLKKVLDSTYPYETIVVDNGSSVPILISHPHVKLLSEEESGKWRALNTGYKSINKDFVITVDADTILSKGAISNLIEQMEKKGLSACAGNLYPLEPKSWVSRMQVYDYVLAIQSIKNYQSIYDNTLVAQGAFSAYRTADLKEQPFEECIAEDIAISWDLLISGKKIGFCRNALAQTDVPNNVRSLVTQRSRWARGLVYGFKRHGLKTLRNPIMSFLLFVPYMDFVYLFCWPIALLLFLVGHPLYFGIMTATVIPLVLINLLFYWNLSQREVRFNIFSFLIFSIVFQAVSSYSSVIGYFQEAFRVNWKWK